MPEPNPSGEQPVVEPGRQPGLADPRIIHPSPEGLFNDDARPSGNEPAESPTGEELQRFTLALRPLGRARLPPSRMIRWLGGSLALPDRMPGEREPL